MFNSRTHLSGYPVNMAHENITVNKRRVEHNMAHKKMVKKSVRKWKKERKRMKNYKRLQNNKNIWSGWSYRNNQTLNPGIPSNPGMPTSPYGQHNTHTHSGCSQCAVSPCELWQVEITSNLNGGGVCVVGAQVLLIMEQQITGAQKELILHMFRATTE